MPIDRDNLSKELAAQIGAIYEQAELEILAKVSRRMLRGVEEPGWAEHKLVDIQALRAEINEVLGGLQAQGVKGLTEAAIEGYIAGSNAATDDLTAHLEDEIKTRIRRETYKTNTRGTRAIARAIAEPGANQFAQSHTTILRNVEDAYKKIVQRAAAVQTTGTINRREAVKRALYQFQEEGIANFTDSRGRKWGLPEYAEMAIRTAVIRSYVQGHVDRFTADGRDLVQVSDSPEECNLCRPWEGKILSLSGKKYDKPATSSRPNRPEEPPAPAEEPPVKPKKEKAPKATKPKATKPPVDYRALYGSASYDYDYLNAEYSAIDEQMYQARKRFYDLHGAYPNKGDDYYYDGLLARRDELDKLIAKAKKEMKKALDNVLPYGSDIGLNTKNDVEIRDHWRFYNDMAREAEQRALDYLDKLRMDDPDNKFAIAHARNQLRLESAARQNVSKLLQAAEKRILVARQAEDRPQAFDAWHKDVQKKIEAGVFDEKAVREVGAILKGQIEQRWEAHFGKKPYGGKAEREEMRRILTQTLDEVRVMGRYDYKGKEAKHTYADDSEEQARNILESVLRHFPNAWLKVSSEYNKVLTKFVDRGYQKGGGKGMDRITHVMLSGTRHEDLQSTALHEWGHRMEEGMPRLVELERQFWDRRTKGSKLEKLKDLLGGGYDDHEVTRKDKFSHPYIGKEYGGRAFEVLTMGLERVFMFDYDRLEWERDPDLMEFILGMLVAG